MYVYNNVDCSNGDVRLVGGYGAYEGTVEVCFENLWGLVSESGWTQEDGEVVCRQLGYPTEGIYSLHYVSVIIEIYRY